MPRTEKDLQTLFKQLARLIRSASTDIILETLQQLTADECTILLNYLYRVREGDIHNQHKAGEYQYKMRHYSLLLKAITHQNEQLVKGFIAHGADPNVPFVHIDRISEPQFPSYDEPNPPDRNFDTAKITLPLSLALATHHRGIIKALQENGAVQIIGIPTRKAHYTPADLVESFTTEHPCPRGTFRAAVVLELFSENDIAALHSLLPALGFTDHYHILTGKYPAPTPAPRP